MLLLILLACTPDPDKPESGCWTVDVDGDGAEGPGGCDPTDCDDADPRVHPGADERCDGADEDCDGDVDEQPVDGSSWFVDDDGDGFGDAEVIACALPVGAAALPGDCDDGDPAVSPGGTETCDGRDEDCDGAVDEDAIDAPTWFVDGDGDGFGLEPVAACTQPSGTTTGDGDCDDTRADVAPSADERCDGADNDCDGIVDEEAVDATTWFEDADGDGFGATPTDACTLPGGASALPGDCDDADASVFPGAAERCDDTDRDCDGDATAGATDPASWFLDLDGDGVGAMEVLACVEPVGAVEEAGDCDDSSADVYPGAPETCDERDEDCDGDVDEDAVDARTWYADTDGDGFGAGALVACTQPASSTDQRGDCNDTTTTISPAAPELCNYVDDDCDDTIDEEAEDAVERWVDADGDGWGDPLASTFVCRGTRGYAANEGDCDDTDATLFNTCPADCSTLVYPPGDVSFHGEGAGPDMAELCLGYNAIAGDLAIEGVVVNDLRHLSCLCEVDGSVTITANSVLSSLSGLDGLRRIGGDLYVGDNHDLASLTGLEALEEIGGTLTVAGNTTLTNHAGLSGLRSVGGLLLSDADTDTVGLETLQEITGDLEVRAGTTLDGLVGLVSIGGSLIVTTPKLTSLAPLAALRSLGGLDLQGAGLGTLAGLESTETISGLIKLDGNAALSDISALSRVTGAVGAVTIQRNSLTSLHGLEGITEATSLSVSGTALTSLAGLAGLQRVNGDLVIDECNKVVDLTGLDALEEVALGVTVSSNNALTSLHGLDALRTSGTVLIDSNTTLASLDGLGSLERIDGDLSVTDNPPLPDLTGLESLVEVTGDLDATGTNEDYEGLVALTTVGGDLRIETSSAGLEALREVGGLLYLVSATCEGLDALVSAGDLTIYTTSGTETCTLPSLTDVTGEVSLYKAFLDGALPALRTAGSIDVSYCASGTTAATLFPRLEVVAGDMTVEDCTTLTELADLPSLYRVDGLLTFDNLDAMTALPAMPLLRSTGGVTIAYHKLLTDLSGLAWLREVDGSVNIKSNSAVDDLTPLYGIGGVSGNFALSGNSAIDDTEAEALRDAIGAENIAGSITISE